jgi:glycosyltransferase involved in cell wall biosynthesis
MISVIVPVYKTEKYLRQCVDSILSQSYGDIDLILIDDGSPDGSGQICDEYARQDTRVRVFHNDNLGVARTRNLGIEKAREAGSDYIIFEDSDDWWSPGTLEALHTAAVENDADIVVCGWVIEFKDASFTRELFDGVFDRIQAMQSFLCREFTLLLTNKLFRASLWDGVYFPDGKRYEDVFVGYKLFDKANTVACVKHPGHHYRQRAESIVHVRTIQNQIEFWRAAAEVFYFFERSEEYSKSRECRDVLREYCSVPIDAAWTSRGKAVNAERREKKEDLKKMAAFVRNNYPRSALKGRSKRRRLVMFLARRAGRINYALAGLVNKLIGPLKKEYQLFD